jgi:hypothetical protein
MIVSMGVREIWPLHEMYNFFYLALELNIVPLVLSLASVPMACSTIPSTSIACNRRLVFGILFLDDKW